MNHNPRPDAAPAERAAPPKGEIERAHRRTRWWFRIRLAVVTLVTIGGVIVGVLPQRSFGALEPLALMAAALGPLMISAVLGRFEGRSLERAADLQQRFDAEYELNGKGAEWYPPTASLGPAKTAAFVVWTNAFWDVPQRRTMANLALDVLVAWTIVGAILSWSQHWCFGDFLLGWAAPSAAIYELLFSAWMRHRDLADARGDLARRALHLLESPQGPSERDAGQLLAEQHALRLAAPRVLDVIQRRNHDAQWKTCVETANRLQQRR